ncbi:phosphoribosyltransferase domain-containing protein [Deinococcus maricopensis]|uniref:Phosphoribosyltransferase n=1 Tax=Deinococcus maricopensis (strain DSM 21211 / LMG 22137 / NRRL B-23946 / LB-34) TaxID=709986 RepID=E8U3T7_DEIML|nr:phosphoribosyltransferase domain-containing protein [Deinococcus maricopensis]ADV68780.1 hypothetical protein Deima_3152 [Deinococcus maricopensis DSM 21211]
MNVTAHAERLPSGTLGLQVERSAQPWPDLLGFGLRENPRRGFLFVSRVLGKHLPVSPRVIADSWTTLAGQLPPDLPGPVLFVGLAETATALGEGVARAYAARTGRLDWTFLHSTRYATRHPVAVRFEEPHSHATAHLIHTPHAEVGAAHFAGARTLVLIDDELSTGTTLTNLGRAYLDLNPGVERVVLVSLTDWCGDRARIGGVLERPVESVSLLRGAYTFTPAADWAPPALPAVVGDGGDKTALLAEVGPRYGTAPLTPDARFGRALTQLKALPRSTRLLVLGTGEFQYLPILLAFHVEHQRPDLQVRASATTRSPILPWGAIGHKRTFRDNYADDIPNYVYNVPDGAYDHIVLAYEGYAAPDPALVHALNATPLQLA